MIVKNYLKLVSAIEHQTNIHDLHDLFLATGDYLNNNPEVVKAQDDFEQMIKQQVADAVFSYYPELKPKEVTLRKELEEIIDESAGEIFSTTFDVIYDYLENPDRFDHDKKWDWRILTDDEILEEALAETRHLSGEDRELSIKDKIQIRKIFNHIYYFNVVLHKAILSCISAVFPEIPILSGNGIRFLDYTLAREASKLRNNMIGLFHMDLLEPKVD